MVYGRGYSSNQSNPKDHCFRTWRNMLKRCYSSEKKYEEYRRQGIVVCDEWLDFDVFKKWYKRNFYEIKDEEMHLDKDIIKHGNKIYCPEYCVFVPRTINMLFVKNKNIRNLLPIGVWKSGKKYISSCSVYGKDIAKSHNDPISAFEEYKQTKENYVKTIANQYRESIPESLYNAMMMFEVNIDD